MVFHTKLGTKESLCLDVVDCRPCVVLPFCLAVHLSRISTTDPAPIIKLWTILYKLRAHCKLSACYPYGMKKILCLKKSPSHLVISCSCRNFSAKHQIHQRTPGIYPGQYKILEGNDIAFL